MKTITPKYLRNKVIGKTILVDSDIIIYLTDSIPPYDQLSKLLFELIEQGTVEAVFSLVSIAEVMSGPLKKGLTSTAMQVRDYLINFPNSHSQKINTDVLNKIGSEERISWAKLRTNDSLIVACGLLAQVDIFVSNDMHFKNAIPAKMILSFDK